MTIMPAAGGPSRTTFHSSGEKAACVVMSGSCVPGVPGHVEDLAAAGRRLHPARVKIPGRNWIQGAAAERGRTSRSAPPAPGRLLSRPRRTRHLRQEAFAAVSYGEYGAT